MYVHHLMECGARWDAYAQMRSALVDYPFAWTISGRTGTRTYPVGYCECEHAVGGCTCLQIGLRTRDTCTFRSSHGNTLQWHSTPLTSQFLVRIELGLPLPPLKYPQIGCQLQSQTIIQLVSSTWITSNRKGWSVGFGREYRKVNSLVNRFVCFVVINKYHARVVDMIR